MAKDVQAYYQKTVLVVTDSWFGNNGLWAPLKQGADGKYRLLSRMRTNIALWDFAPIVTGKKERGRPRIYGNRLGSVDDCAARWQLP
ncbi:transposase [Desulfogranum japonicum]|uniref:transposase n=1 Tax=Desulfogranum japonicum TaxID=231447 RepID=UPI0004141990|nr:transposase [Desulfogranum japonicum]